MLDPKYYTEIREAQEQTRELPKGAPLPEFNINDLGADSLRRRIQLWLFEVLVPLVLSLLREFWPVAKIGRLVIVTRADDVRDTLTRTEEFGVPFALEMTELADGENFVLGMDGESHAEEDKLIENGVGDQRSPLVVSRSFPDGTGSEEALKIAMAREDVERVAKLSHRFAGALLRNSGGRIDVMKDYITRVATETCIRYFGLTGIDDPNAFAEWAMSISALLFGDPFGDPATRQLALNGSARIRNVIDRSIIEQRKSPTDTVLGRLVKLQSSNSNVSDGKIRAILVGMIAGFIPTNTLAAGRILQELLRRPQVWSDALAKASAAMKADQANSNDGGIGENADKQALQVILYEALRLNPPLMPGQWRYVNADTDIGTDPGRRRRVLANSVLLVATLSALRDRRAIDSPTQFKPDRNPACADMAFGFGMHHCLGKYLAMAQITELFMILFSQPGLRRCDDTWGRRIRWVGPFPCRLDMQFTPAAAPATQTMLTICVPLADGVKPDEVREQITAFGNPATASIRKIFDDTGVVHFASLSIIEAGNAAQPAPHLLLELSADGTNDSVIDAIAAQDAKKQHLASIFKYTILGKEPLADILKQRVLDLQTRPWGAIGLNFYGTDGFAVADIDEQDELSTYTKEVLDYFLTFHIGFGNRAMEVLRFVRTFILYPEPLKKAAGKMPADAQKTLLGLLERGGKFADFLIVPSRRTLAISDWTPCSRRTAAWNLIKSPQFRGFSLSTVALAVALIVAIFCAIEGGWLGLPGRIALALSGGLATTVGLLAVVAALLVGLLRYHETRDIPDDKNPAISSMRKIAAIEDPPGFAQNHFMAVTDLKSGWFRKLTLAAALWGIKQMVLFLFRPGFVLDMGTIHYAKWFRLPGRDKLIFQANYDGSWQSYLEDFIMKAHLGQTAAWSNGVGFPETRFLILDGAQDGDRFKRWVRRQQIIAPLWYSRFPHLTTDQIRNNALIHDGLARASTDSEARDWLDCFGSLPRPDYAIETSEVQSLVFRGFRTLPHVVCALIELPKAGKDSCAWLNALIPGTGLGGHAANYNLDNPCQITFGDNPFSADRNLREEATFVGLTADGLKKLGLRGSENTDGLGSFPSAFNMGMANRSRILGDFEDAPANRWRWLDSEPADDIPPRTGLKADAVLLLYGKTIERCHELLERHRKVLGGEARFHVIETQPTAKGIDYEHFGFRDGISQPVIRGTQRFSKGSSSRDVVEPGEFILGYRNNQGYYPPTTTVGMESDAKNRLPTVLATSPSRFPSFEPGNSAIRDFGRNGSFLVIRQLAQNVAGFNDFLAKQVKELEPYDGLAGIEGARIDEKWLAAKLMGRWQDGTPLIVRPGADKLENAPKHLTRDNDFGYGMDDPQGLHCPFGAHIRRANPRDSLDPDDPDEQAVTNRHRLLRRGRTYEVEAVGDATQSQGLLFTCLCADLERQFEFVQQTWLRSPAFAGLQNEPDPIVGWQEPKQRVFTIPTASGPLRLHKVETFVTVRGGGYFFLPSRSAILYLADINQA
jgi:Dyp-type peroxidase family